MHEEIHQHGTHDAALRRAAIARTNLTGLGYRGRLQPSPDIQQHPLTVRVLAQCLPQQIVIEIVERSFDVKLEHPVVLPASLTGYPNRILRRARRPIAVRVRVKMRLEHLLQKLLHYCLCHPVRHRGHPENADSAALLRNAHLLHWRWKVAPRGHAVPDRVELARKVLLEPLDTLLIDPRCTPVRSHALPCLPDLALADRK